MLEDILIQIFGRGLRETVIFRKTMSMGLSKKLYLISFTIVTQRVWGGVEIIIFKELKEFYDMTGGTWGTWGRITIDKVDSGSQPY